MRQPYRAGSRASEGAAARSTSPDDALAIQADLRPLKSWQETVPCAAFARTGGGKVKVSLKGGTVFSVDRFRLYEPRVAGKAPGRIADSALDALPWEGSGPDPLGQNSGRRASSTGALV